MASIMSVLKKVYKEGLAPYGFIQTKGKYPYFVRVIGGEIVHVITFRKCSGPVIIFNGKTGRYYPGLREFEILGGIATVYRKKLDLSTTASENINWLWSNRDLYYKSNYDNYDVDYEKKISVFRYINDDDNSIIKSVNFSLDVTKKEMISRFDNVTDLNACIRFYEDYRLGMIYLSDDKKYGWTDDSFGYNYENEGMLYIKTKSNDDFKIQTERACKRELDSIKKGEVRSSMEDYNNFCKRMEERRIEKIQIRDRILNTPEIYSNAVKELEERKMENIQMLNNCGITI